MLLSQDKGHIDSLAQAFSEGKFIVILTQIALVEKVHGAKNDPAYLKHKLSNTQKCIEMLSNKGIVLESVTPEDIVNGQKTLIETVNETQVDVSIEDYRQENKREKKAPLEIPSHKPSNKFLPSPPLKHTETSLPTEEEELKKTETDAKILRTKSKEDTVLHSQKTQLKQRRYSPLDISKLAGRLFDAFSSFSNNDLPELAEETNEEPKTMDTLQADHVSSKDTTHGDVTNTAESADNENLTVLPPLSLDDLSPEVEDESVKKDAKRLLRKSKRQATSIDSFDILSARESQDDITDLNLNLSPLPNTVTASSRFHILR